MQNGRIDLASVTDSGDRHTITRDYAAEHVHLAYASTVHGIQGETVHASYTGPGVDAAGLYVGMTRGRIANTALTVARDLEKAIEQLADTILRGKLEVTLDDARRAVRSELGRAARNPGRRQLGAQLAERDARHRALRRALRDSDARAATLDATSHGRSCDPAIADAIQDIATQHEALLAALETERAQVDALLRDYQADLSREREQVTAPVNPWEQDPMMPIAPDQNRPARGL